MTKPMLLLAVVVASAAQLDAQTDKKSINIVNLDNIVISATRVEKSVPVAFYDISEKDIERANGGRDIASLLQFTPSMVVTSDAGAGIGYTDIHLRGTDGTRINVTTNGVPMNDAESHKVYWVDTPDLISSIGTIQIQRGVGASTNGAGAFGGSINMTTNAISEKPGAEVSFSQGSYATNKEAVKLSSGLLGGHFALDGRFSHISTHGYMDRAFSNLNSYMFQAAYYGTNTSMKYLVFGGHERTYNAWDGLTKEMMWKYGRTYNPCGEITDADGNVSGFYSNQTDNYTQINNQFIVNHRFDKNWTFNITAHYTRGNGYYNQWKNNYSLDKILGTGYREQFDMFQNTKKSNLIRKKYMANDFYGIVSSVGYKKSNLELNIGGAANAYNGDHWGDLVAVESVADFVEPIEYYRNYSRKTDANVFVKATWKVTKGLNIFGDVQYRNIKQTIYGNGSSYQDKYDSDWNLNRQMQKLNLDKSWDFLNPKFGLSYINGNHSAYASFAVAQKEPTRDDFVNAQGVSPKSETLYDWELGYQFANDMFTAGVNLYWMEYRDQLILTGGINTETYDPLYVNAPKSHRAGIELLGEIRPWSFLKIGANATFSQNKISDFTESIYSNDTYTNVDRFVGKSDIAYSPNITAVAYVMFDLKGFDASLKLQHVGKQYINNSKNDKDNLYLDAYTVCNFDAGYTFTMPQNVKWMRSVRLALSVNNLLNNHYVSHAYIYDASTTEAAGDNYEVRYFPQATRNYLLNLTMKF